ncbi:MAG: hypothetical protein J5589_07820 [Firmicutes bacterium]|nr:hypothetical protein [Bacillota bacterium]
MNTDCVSLDLNGREQRLMVNSLVGFRNGLIIARKPTEDVDELLLKVIDAPPKKKSRWRDRDAR